MFKKLINFVYKILDKLHWLPGLLARLTLGILFTTTGWGKLHNLEKVTGFFTSLGIPFPHQQAILVASTEFVCGLLLIAGAFTRLAAIPLSITMVVALITAKRADIGEISDLFSITEYLYLVLLIWLAIAGGGALSVDRFIFKKNK